MLRYQYVLRIVVQNSDELVDFRFKLDGVRPVAVDSEVAGTFVPAVAMHDEPVVINPPEEIRVCVFEVRDMSSSEVGEIDDGNIELIPGWKRYCKMFGIRRQGKIFELIPAEEIFQWWRGRMSGFDSKQSQEKQGV